MNLPELIDLEVDNPISTNVDNIMNFSKLSNQELDDFIFLNGEPIPEDRDDKIQLAEEIYSRNNVKYTIPIIDLYLATNLISPTDDKKYQYSNLLKSKLSRLGPLFQHFDLSPNEENRHRLIHILSLGDVIEYQPGDLSSLIQLPTELLWEILLDLSDKELSKLCRSAKIKGICRSDDFWHDRFDRHFGESVEFPGDNLSWRQIYELYTTSRVIKITDKNHNLIAEKRIFPHDTVYHLVDYLHTLSTKRLLACKLYYGPKAFVLIQETLYRGRNLQITKSLGSGSTYGRSVVVSEHGLIPYFNYIYEIQIDVFDYLQ